MTAIPGKLGFTSVEPDESLPFLVNQHRRFTHIGLPLIAPYLRGQDTGYLLLSCV